MEEVGYEILCIYKENISVFTQIMGGHCGFQIVNLCILRKRIRSTLICFNGKCHLGGWNNPRVWWGAEARLQGVHPRTPHGG